MTQSVVVQVGQCGNQIGCRFWDLALREHAYVNKKGRYDEAIGSFFRNVDSRQNCGVRVGEKIHQLKARAVLVDMEEGVVNQILQGPLRDVFDSTQLLTDVSGSGNNWAVGYMTYGSAYREQIVEKLRKTAEHCDCLQCFFLIHSMGGEEDDVVTSPYNSVLAMRELSEHADCVLPVENQSLVNIVNRISRYSGKAGSTMRMDSAVISGHGGLSAGKKPFDTMNNIVANLLLHMTSSARFQGSLNMDLNEIPMNLVPFPRLHYLVPSLTPLYTLADVSMPPRRLDQMFSDAFSKEQQLIEAEPRHSLYLACALLLRGNVGVSDLQRNIQRLRPTLPFIWWNREGWKASLCSVPPVGHSHSLLALANNTCLKATFSRLHERFMKLYRKKAHLHHYLHVEGLEQSAFSEAVSSLSSLIAEYQQLDITKDRIVPNAPRLGIAT
ncbi:tubulin epsilon chain isoform X2 [Boleophthalmus pectinirostris]|uniref:tubulin epsilon chain isoform X2 n=1 Tax=Boleophthalmus pectinirostris TaxID=150288 RepID=UPI00242E784C|nr:tubulin epsilon chain isoform X2 [Boleophthalmus pectinirostris]